MYRQSLQEQKMASVEAEDQPQFLNRMVQLPVVATAMDQLTSLYSKTKESNRLVKYTLQTAESGVLIIAKTAQPVINKLEKPIGQLDQIACAQLEKLENRYPLITKPTDEVYDGTVKPTVDQVSSRIKPSVDAYNSAKQYGTDKVNGVKTYTSTKLGNVQEYTYSTLDGVRQYSTRSVEAALCTHYGQVLNKSVAGLLDVTDNYVDYYLPPDNDDEKAAEGDQAVETTENAAALASATRLCSKLQHRLALRAQRQVGKVQTGAQESIHKLRYTVELMHHVREHMTTVPGKVAGMPAQLASLPASTRDRLTELWQEINQTEEQAEQHRVEDSEYPPTLERRLVSTARHLTQRLKTALTVMASSSHLLPDAVQTRLKETRQTTEDLYYMFTSTEKKFGGVTGIMVDQGHAYLNAISDGLVHVSSHFNKFSPFSWLMAVQKVMKEDVEMEDMAAAKLVVVQDGEEDGVHRYDESFSADDESVTDDDPVTDDD